MTLVASVCYNFFIAHSVIMCAKVSVFVFQMEPEVSDHGYQSQSTDDDGAGEVLRPCYVRLERLPEVSE